MALSKGPLCKPRNYNTVAPKHLALGSTSLKQLKTLLQMKNSNQAVA